MDFRPQRLCTPGESLGKFVTERVAMKFGIMLNHEYPKTDDLGTRIEQLVQFTRTARDCGYDSLFGLQHYLSSLATIQVLPLLSRLIPESGSMSLGTGVYLATFEHPVQLAENFASLDHLSDGRLILGVGAGYRKNEFKAFGVDRPSRWERLPEVLELLEKLWTGEEVNHRGRFYTVEGESVSMTPKQSPGPPIWIGANAERTIRRSAQIGDAWIAPPNVKMRWAQGHLGFFKEELERRGIDPVSGREHPIIREMYIADSDEDAVREAEQYIRAEYTEYSNPEYGKDVQLWKTMFDDFREKSFLFGSADTIAHKLSAFADAGFNHFIFRVSWSGMPFELSLRSIERFAEEVMPRFQEIRA